MSNSYENFLSGLLTVPHREDGRFRDDAWLMDRNHPHMERFKRQSQHMWYDAFRDMTTRAHTVSREDKRDLHKIFNAALTHTCSAWLMQHSIFDIAVRVEHWPRFLCALWPNEEGANTVESAMRQMHRVERWFNVIPDADEGVPSKFKPLPLKVMLSFASTRSDTRPQLDYMLDELRVVEQMHEPIDRIPTEHYDPHRNFLKI